MRRHTPKERYDAMRVEYSHKDNDTFENVVAKHGIAITDMIRLFYLQHKQSYAAVFFVLKKLNEAWIELICTPDECYFSADDARQREYRKIVKKLITDFTKELVSSVITENEFDPGKGINLAKLLEEIGDGTTVGDVRRELRHYVNCAWETAQVTKKYGIAENHYICSNNTVVAGMSLGMLLDQVLVS